MAGMVKKRPVDSSSTGQANNHKHTVAPRQRGIPTRVYKHGDNRNLRPASQIQLSSSESLENKDQELNGNLDNVDSKTGTISRRSESSLSGPTASVHKANSVKLITECDNRSRLTSSESAFVGDQDVSKPVNRVKASLLSAYNPGKLRSVAKPSVEQSSPIRSAHLTESSHNSFRSPKRFTGNRNCFSKNVNKMSSSDETCALKSPGASLCLNGTVDKEISVSVDHIAVGEEQRNSTTVGLVNAREVFVSDSSVISEPVVSGMCLKEISHDKANERSVEQAAETKRLFRGHPGTVNNCNRSKLRPHSSGGLNTSRNNQKFRQSTSNERTAGNRDSITRCANRQPTSDSGAVNSLEMEQEGNKRRKGSGGTGIKVPPLKEMSGRCEAPNSPKAHAVARNQNALTSGAGSKTDKGLKNHVNAAVSGLYKNLVLPSRRVDVQGRQMSAKLSSVPKILVSHDSRDLEMVPVNSQPSSSGTLQNNDDEVTVSKSSPVSCSAAEALPVNDLGPADNRQAQPMVQIVNGDTSEDPSRRLFRTRPHAAKTDEHPKMGCYVEMDEERSGFHNHHMGTEERKCTSESEDVVVLGGEMYQQMMDDFKALKVTILRLQHVLIESGTVESQIGDNEWKSTVKAHCYDGGDEVKPGDGQIQLAHVCQENIRLQNKVDELEKLLQEQAQMISILRQKSAPYDIKMLPGIESPTSEADVELHHKNNCFAAEHNVELPASSLSSRFSLTHGCKSKINFSNNVASPPSSPQRPRYQHTTSPVLHFAWKSEKQYSPTTSNKAFTNNDCETDYLCNDARESWFSCDYDRPVVHGSQDDGRHVALPSTNSADLSQAFELSPRKRLRKATQSGQEDEEFNGDYSMFDYNCSVDSDSELGPGIYDAHEGISVEATDAGENGMPAVIAEHCIPAGKLINEESEHCRSTARESRPGTRDAGDASCANIGAAEADACDNNMGRSAQTDQNFNRCLIENGFCDHLGNFDQSFSSNSLVSSGCTEQEKNIYKMLRSDESSSRGMSKYMEESAFNLPVSLDRQTAELWSYGDMKLEKALIKQPPKCETSSIPSLPCNPVSDEAKSVKRIQSSQSSNVTLSKVPNQTQTLLRMPKCHVSMTSSSCSAASAPLSGICSLSGAVHVVPLKPESSNVRQRQLKEPTSSRLPSLRFSKVQKLSTPVSK